MKVSLRQSAFAVVLISIASFVSIIQGQTLRERHERVRALVDAQNYASAIEELQAWRTSQPDVFIFNNYDYLLARLSERMGDRATAAVNYQRISARKSLLSEYAIWHLAQFARMTGNLILEREQIRQLLATAPKSELRDSAWARLGQSYFESGDFDSAIFELKQRAASTAGSTARQTLALLGQSYVRNNQPALAREVFNKLILELADASRPDDFALVSALGLDALDSGSDEAAPTSAPQLPEAEHLRRAKIYHFNRDFARARLHYAAVIRNYPQSAAVPNALYQLSRSYYQDGMYEDSMAGLSRLLARYPEGETAQDAQSLLASSFARLRRTDEAVAGYRRLIERYPDSPEPERPFLNVIDVYRDAGRDPEALEWVERTREKFAGKLPAALALFSRAKIFLAESDWARALSDLDALRGESDLGGASLPGGTTPNEISYLRAYVLEQMGRTDSAVKAYLEISDGRGEYYGGRATERLRALAGNGNTRSVILSFLDRMRADAQRAISNNQPEQARIAAQSAIRLTDDRAIAQEMFEIARRAYVALPSYNAIPTPQLLSKGRTEILSTAPSQPTSEPTLLSLANELLFLGLYDEGAPALAAADDDSNNPIASTNSQSNEDKKAVAIAVKSASPPRPGISRDEAYTLAVLFKRGELAEHAIRYAEPMWKTVPRDYLIELAPREMVELLYPAPYLKTLNEYAPSRGVDPRFVLSIMRQESRFRPDAKSPSAARGLMQFIPATATKIAAQLGKHNFQNDVLYNPRDAILFGSQYLGNLFELFPNMPQAVAASYNGGEDNVARWIARAHSKDPDRYVPDIAFSQAKDYVYKVMSNYRVYTQLYGEELLAK